MGRYVGLAVLALVAILGLTWVAQGNDFFLYKTFAPKQEQVRRETFEQSKAYRQGRVQELQNMQFEYIQADSTAKIALASVILHRAADFNVNDMPPDLAKFIRELQDQNRHGW